MLGTLRSGRVLGAFLSCAMKLLACGGGLSFSFPAYAHSVRFISGCSHGKHSRKIGTCHGLFVHVLHITAMFFWPRVDITIIFSSRCMTTVSPRGLVQVFLNNLFNIQALGTKIPGWRKQQQREKVIQNWGWDEISPDSHHRQREAVGFHE